MEPKKANPSTLKEMVVSTTSTTQTIRNYVLYVLLAVVIATAFFIHEAYPTTSEKYDQAKTNWEVAKSEYNTILNELKELNAKLYNGSITLEEFSGKQYALFDEYAKANKKKNELFTIVSGIKSEANFFQFNSFQYFLGEIGWAVGLFIYALANLLNTFFLKRRYMRMEFTGKILLHGTLLFIGCFYTFYVFYSKQDFGKVWYVLSMALCTVTLVFASKFIIDVYLKRTDYLKQNIKKLIAFIFKIRNKHYKVVAVKALYAEIHDESLKTEDTVTDNANEFEEDFYDTIEKIN